MYKLKTRERLNSLDVSASPQTRPVLTTRLRALSVLESRGAIDATQKSALKDALVANNDEKLNETLDKFCASNGLGAADTEYSASAGRRLRAASLSGAPEASGATPTLSARGKAGASALRDDILATDPGLVDCLGEDLENIMSLDNLDRRPSFLGSLGNGNGASSNGAASAGARNGGGVPGAGRDRASSIAGLFFAFDDGNLVEPAFAQQQQPQQPQQQPRGHQVDPLRQRPPTTGRVTVDEEQFAFDDEPLPSMMTSHKRKLSGATPSSVELRRFEHPSMRNYPGATVKVEDPSLRAAFVPAASARAALVADAPGAAQGVPLSKKPPGPRGATSGDAHRHFSPAGMGHHHHSLPPAAAAAAPSAAAGAAHEPPAPTKAGGNREASIVIEMKDLPPLDASRAGPAPPYEEVINYARTKGRGQAHHCVMCGREGRPPTADDSSLPSNIVIIPTQNKDVCKICDTVTWKHCATLCYFKWCKGCKRFHNLDSFAGKLKASKCDASRARGRAGYMRRKDGTPNLDEGEMSVFPGGDGFDGLGDGFAETGLQP